jgi:hypothetical protein
MILEQRRDRGMQTKARVIVACGISALARAGRPDGRICAAALQSTLPHKNQEAATPHCKFVSQCFGTCRIFSILTRWVAWGASSEREPRQLICPVFLSPFPRMLDARHSDGQHVAGLQAIMRTSLILGWRNRIVTRASTRSVSPNSNLVIMQTELALFLNNYLHFDLTLHPLDPLLVLLLSAYLAQILPLHLISSQFG